MWVRSQDKTILIESSYFSVDNTRVFSGTSIEGDTVTGNILVGTYNSKERAIEVLDDIQKQLVNGTSGENFEYSYQGDGVYQINRKWISNSVYQMPEE